MVLKRPLLARSVGVLLAALIFVACTSGEVPEASFGGSSVTSDPSPGASPATTTTVFGSTTSIAAFPNATVTTTASVIDREMTLEEKAAQLLMVEFSGSSGANALDLLSRFPVGGFLLKSANGNFESSDQVREMISQLQTASSMPLLIAVDQEGGRIDRIQFADFQRFPAAQVFGALGDPELTEQAAWATGIQLASLGINVDFAPVADVNVLGDANPAIGDRSYGDDPDRVALMTVAAVRGFTRSGIAPAVKHFPGHGNTAVDSHLGLPVVLTQRDEWAATDLVPFAAAVDDGVPMVMVAHVAYPALDPEGLPASLSPLITHEQLRVGLGFEGVIVTDDLANMAAVSGWDPGERAVRALLAGSDLLLNPGDVEAAVSAIVAAVNSGRIEERLIDEALTRLVGLKTDLGILDRAPAQPPTPESLASIAALVADLDAACAEVGLDC